MVKIINSCIFIILFASLLLPDFCVSQITTTKGLKFGINLSKFHGDDSKGTTNKSGLIFGGFATSGVDKPYGMQIEILYTSKGAKYTSANISNFYLNITYIEFPVLFRLSSPSANGRQMFLLIGPSFDYKLNHSFTDESGNKISVQNTKIKNTDYNLIFGVGILLSSRWLIEGRYTYGMDKFQTAEYSTSNEYFDIKNSVFSLMAGVKF